MMDVIGVFYSWILSYKNRTSSVGFQLFSNSCFCRQFLRTLASRKSPIYCEHAMNTQKIGLFLSYAFCLLLISLAMGCSSQPEGPDPSENSDGLPSGSFARLQRTVFNQHCASSGCHTSSSKAGGLVLEASVSYNNLVDIAPRNTAANSAGFKRVKPSRPDSSFLFLKLGTSLAGEYGERMPLNSTNGLSSSAREFIRQWIAAGAPYSGDVADQRLLLEPVVVSDPFTPLAPPQQGIQLHLRPFAIDPGKEREIFVYDRSSNSDTLYVNRIEVKMREGSHHFILYKVSSGIALQPGVVRELNSQSLFQEMQLEAYREFMIGSQTPSLSYTLPEGVVLSVSPNQGFDLNSHYVNASTSSVLVGEAYVNLHTVPKSSNQKVAIPIFDNYVSFVLPRRQRTVVQRTVTYPDARNVFMLTSHTHKRGESFKIFLVGGPDNGKLVYENYSWDHPVMKTYSPPLRFEAGWGYRIEVTYNNETDRDIRFGLTSEDEMCIVIGYYFH
jgi:hypothetical protein